MNKTVNIPKTHLSVSATGNDLVFLWMVAHRPEDGVGNHHLKACKSPTGGDAEEPVDKIKERTDDSEMTVMILKKKV